MPTGDQPGPAVAGWVQGSEPQQHWKGGQCWHVQIGELVAREPSVFRAL